MTKPTPTRERVRANLERLLEGRESEIADAIGSPDLTPGQRVSNLRRYVRSGGAARFPPPESLDMLSDALGVDVSELFKETR